MNESTRSLLTDAASLSVQSYRLQVMAGPQVGSEWDLGQKSRVGKGADNDIVIADATVSRNHFELQVTPQGVLVRDVGSTNGTFLDNTRIVEAYFRPAMELRAGEVKFRLVAMHQDLTIEPSTHQTFSALVGQSPAMRRIFTLLQRVAPTDATILILGETGTGKGAVAKAIHDQSHRHDAPFVTVDCGGISKSLIESELFGHEKGSFTGAVSLRRGALEMCQGGTLFIDELDDLPLDVQPKLLRALDAREIYRVGSTKAIKLDMRVIAATKKDLRIEIEAGRFREDLFFRLSVVSLVLPPLRQRLEDVPLLAEQFLTPESHWGALPAALRQTLQSYHFPGNVRELRNLLERASYLEGFEAIDPTTFPTSSRGASTVDGECRLAVDYNKPFKTAKEALLERFEREYLKRLLAKCGQNVSRAAREAKIDRKHLYVLLTKHGLDSKEGN